MRMVDGATGEHQGERKKGAAYMLLSRDTYANNKRLDNELIDNSLHWGTGRMAKYEAGGTFGGSPTPLATTSAQANSQELLQLLRETHNVIHALPNRQFIGWDHDDTAELEQRLADRAAEQIR